MAEIPVRKTGGGVPWWAWLLGLILLALIAWFLIGAFDDDDRNAAINNDRDAVVTTTDNNRVVNSNRTGKITSFAMLNDINNMVGREVDLDNVQVQSLSGDMSFYIGTSTSNRVWVVFDETPTPGTAKEGEHDINRGDYIELEGVIRSAAKSLPRNVTATIPSSTRAYIYATELDVK